MITLKTVIKRGKLRYYEFKINNHHEAAKNHRKAAESLQPLISDGQIRKVYDNCLTEAHHEEAWLKEYRKRYYNVKYRHA